jgi:hypothetical protein
MQGWHAGVFFLDCEKVAHAHTGLRRSTHSPRRFIHRSQTHVNLPSGEKIEESGILDKQINLRELGSTQGFDASQYGSTAPLQMQPHNDIRSDKITPQGIHQNE